MHAPRPARIETATAGKNKKNKRLNGISRSKNFDDALKVLAETPGLKANNLTIKVEVDGDHRVILIVSPDGQIVRRLSESQLWAATRDKDRQTGKFLDKAM